MEEQTLSPKWLRRACRLNPYYKERLHWSVPGGWPDDVGGAAFAERVAAFQAEHGGLTVDGILGPKTWEALQGRTFEPPAREHLVIGGELVPVPFPVVTWLEPGGLSFYGKKGWAKRRDLSGAGVNLFVLHWDGCTSSHQCFHVLLDRGLSVHLMLDGDGTVYQALDLAEARA
ncbi:MAG: peptidoglycan-binding protein [Myxococcales bacterium]|nr:peptidoglycan-binding protein [Myxococcales bacterium]